MDRNVFIEQVGKRLDSMNIPYQTGKGADIAISAEFKKQKDDEDDAGVLFYFATMFLNREKNTVYAHEKVMAGDKDISDDKNLESTVVELGDGKGTIITVGSILGTAASAAGAMGLSFQKAADRNAASYPPGFIPFSSGVSAAGQKPANAETKRFCSKCGTKMKEGARFCPSCGSDAQKPRALSIPSRQPEIAAKKRPVGKIILVTVLIAGVLAVGGILLNGMSKDKKQGADSENTATTAGTTAATKAPAVTSAEKASTDSAAVSSGVEASDLGNIMNGQYYFAADKLIFYSSFDENDKAHIYSVKKDGSELKAIFDGFGWSLVVIDDWLYFSGNQGDQIDGTYNIFRMKQDGSQLEKINSEFSYGMFFYGGYLYYMKRDPDYQDSMSVCRSYIDGSREEVLFPNGFSPVVYKNLLYYHDNQGNMFRTRPDGTEPEVLLTAAVKSYVLSNEKIVYTDFNNNIYACDLDGQNIKLMKSVNNATVYSVNAYGGRIFYSEYDTGFNYSAYGYDYTIKSCDMEDGSDEKTVFSSTSYGIYMNLVNNKLMLMDYAINQGSGAMNAAIKVMDLDGSNVDILGR